MVAMHTKVKMVHMTNIGKSTFQNQLNLENDINDIAPLDGNTTLNSMASTKNH